MGTLFLFLQQDSHEFTQEEAHLNAPKMGLDVECCNYSVTQNSVSMLWVGKVHKLPQNFDFIFHCKQLCVCRQAQ